MLRNKHCEIRYRLMSLLFIRVASIEGRITQAINTIYKIYREDGDKLSILVELARIVIKSGCIEYVGEAMGALEEIETRGCNERNRDVYFIMAQVEILRGNVMIGYKLFIEALNHLNPGQDDIRIDYINSFILAYKNNILKAIELEHLIENKVELTSNQFKKVIKDLKHINIVDKKYSDLLKIKLHSLVIKDPFEFMEMIEEVYNQRRNDIKLAIYYLDLAFKHKDLVKMTRLRDQILLIAEDNENISTCEYVDAMDLIYRIYSFQGKFRQAIEILDRINFLLPELPKDYDLNRIRELIHLNQDETSENTDEYNIKVGPVPILDFSYIEKLNITKLIMKDINSDRQDRSMLSDKSPEKISKERTNDLIIEKENMQIHSNFDFSKELSLSEVNDIKFKNKEEILAARESDDNDLNATRKANFLSFSNPKYYFEKGKLCCKVILDYDTKKKSDLNEDGIEDMITFEKPEKDDEVIKVLTGREYNELLEEALSALVEYLLNLFYRKQYYEEENFNKMKSRAFFWVSIALFKLKRYGESLELIRKYSLSWSNYQKFIKMMVEEMFQADPLLKQTYGGDFLFE